MLFHKNQKFNDPVIRLDIAKYILTHYKEQLNKESVKFEVTDFTAKKLVNIGSRKIIKNGNCSEDGELIFKSVENSPYEWLYYDKFSTDSDTEKEFLEFIEANKERIDRNFSEWIIMRNEGFKEFKIYDNRKGQNTYGEGFEPDFIFFGKPKEQVKLDYLSAEIIMESKGPHLYSKDKWKEDLILDKTILNKKVFGAIKDISTKVELNLFALPFFFEKKYAENKNFEEQFYDFFK